MKVIPKYQFGNNTKAGINVTYLDPSLVMPLVADNMGKSIVLDEQVVTPYKKLPMQSDFFEGETNQAANERADEHAKRVAPTAEDLFTVGTLGGMNNLSPTQWVRRAYDLGEAIKGNMSWNKFGNNWFYGNNGVLSDEYARKNPNAAMAINLAGDVAAFGGANLLRRMPTYYRMMLAENLALNKLAKNSNLLVKNNPPKSRLTLLRNIAKNDEKPSILSNLNDWLLLWTERSGLKYIFSNRHLKRLFGKAKQDLLSYIRGDEFKQRVMNSLLFTEDEYPILVDELEKLVQNSKYTVKTTEAGAINSPETTSIFDENGFFSKYKHTGSSKVKLSEYQSPTLLRANNWHELFHSIGGHNEYVIENNPLVARLRAYNESINPTELSKSMKDAGDQTTLRNMMIRANQNESANQIDNWVNRETESRNWLMNNIVQKPSEVRSRMATTLDRFRQLGYDTRELVSNPNKFKDWIREILEKRIYMPWDTLHLLASFDIDDLAKYASKMLTTTGGVYLGSKIFDTDNNFKTQ